MIPDLSGLTPAQFRLLYSLALRPRRVRPRDARTESLFVAGYIDRWDQPRPSALRALLIHERKARMEAEREASELRSELSAFGGFPGCQ